VVRPRSCRTVVVLSVRPKWQYDLVRSCCTTSTRRTVQYDWIVLSVRICAFNMVSTDTWPPQGMANTHRRVADRPNLVALMGWASLWGKKLNFASCYSLVGPSRIKIIKLRINWNFVFIICDLHLVHLQAPGRRRAWQDTHMRVADRLSLVGRMGWASRVKKKVWDLPLEEKKERRMSWHVVFAYTLWPYIHICHG
jgi:hypothetical protein